MSGPRGKAAYMEEADEEGQILRGTRVAASVAPSPTKEKANNSDSTILSPRNKREKEPRPRMREKERGRIEREREREREMEHEREREHRRSTKRNSGARPAVKTSKTSPVVHYTKKDQESDYYGFQAANASNPRFRSGNSNAHYGGGVPIPGSGGGRSMSYHGKPHPPPSNLPFYSSSPYGPSSPFGPPPSLPYSQAYGSSYGSSYGGPPSALGPHHPSHHPSLPPGSPVDSYLDGRGHEHLKQRFQSARPASALGFRQSRRASYYDDYDDEDHDPPPTVSRKASVKGQREMRDRQDRAAMPPPPPPPPRPKSTRPGMLRSHPPPPTHKSRDYDDDESFDEDESIYRDIPGRRSVEFSSSQPRSRRMSIAHGGGAALQLREPSTGPSRSRHDAYGGVEDDDYEYGYDDKVREQLAKAGAYHHAVSGGLTQALTKDALQKATKRSQGGSSRSTRSSDSHEESEWRNSATTRTTRSIAGEDDFTIKVTGQAVVEVSGTKIQCQDGSAISISSRPPPPQGRLSDSDKGSIEYEERKRLPYRSRAMSQSGGAYLRQARGAYDMYPDDDRSWA